MDCGRCANGHAIIGGCGHLGSRIAAEMLERGCEVVVIDVDPNSAVASRLENAGCTIVRGSIRDEDILDRVGIAGASCFIAATGDDRANLEAAITARQKNENCTVITRLYDQALGERVEKVFRIRALSASFLASPAYVSAATDDSIISAFNVDGCCISIHSASAKPSRSRGCYVKITPTGLRLCSDPSEGQRVIALLTRSAVENLVMSR